MAVHVFEEAIHRLQQSDQQEIFLAPQCLQLLAGWLAHPTCLQEAF
jgi:hypothetical protein